MFKKLAAVVVFACAALPRMTAAESIRLRFEVYKNGALIASPELAVAEKALGRLDVDSLGVVEFRPQKRTPDTLAVGFDIATGGRHLGPCVTIKSTPASMSWKSDDGRTTYKIRVAWIH